MPDGTDETELLRLAGALEHASEHPVAQAVAAGAARRTGSPLPTVEESVSAAGLGVRGVVEGHAVLVGRPRLLTDAGIDVPDALSAVMADAAAEGRTTVVVAWDGTARGVLGVADTVKESSAEAVTELRRLGLRPVLPTGDNRAVAESVARSVGIGEVYTEVVPEEKVHVIEGLRAEGRAVAMVGDGVNDAAALSTADLGLAMGTGADAAIEAGDHPRSWRSQGGGRRDPPVPPHSGHHQGQPLLGIWLQRCRPTPCGIWPAQPYDYGSGDGVLLSLRRDEQPAVAHLHLISTKRSRSHRFQGNHSMGS